MGMTTMGRKNVVSRFSCRSGYSTSRKAGYSSEAFPFTVCSIHDGGSPAGSRLRLTEALENTGLLNRARMHRIPASGANGLRLRGVKAVHAVGTDAVTELSR